MLNVLPALKNYGDIFEFEEVISLPEQTIYGETIEIDPITVNGIFTFSEEELLISGDFIANIHGKCGVCLKEVSENLNIKFSEIFIKNSNAHSNEFEGDDVEKFLFSGSEINLEDMILQNLLPQIPMKFKCAENCSNNVVFASDLNNETNDNPFNVLQNFFINDEEV